MRTFLSGVAAAIVSLPAAVSAQDCPEQSAVLTGSTVQAMPALGDMTYTERVTLERDRGGEDLSGLWRLARYETISVYPTPGMGGFSAPAQRIDYGDGTYMHCAYDFVGSTVTGTCEDGNVTLRFADGVVRWANDGTAMGSYDGRQVTFRFPTGMPGSPTLTGSVVDGGASGDVSLAITVTTGEDGRHAFSAGDPGQLTIEARAEVSPASLASEVVWTFPDLPGAMRVPPGEPRGLEASATYVGVPPDNGSFGPHIVSARVDAGACPAADSEVVRVFFNRDASNNPRGDQPNWLYYWGQTACGRPYGAEVNLIYDADYPDCRAGGTLGSVSYDPVWEAHNSIYVCDIPAVAGLDMAQTFPSLRRTTQANGDILFEYLGDYSTTGVDTFGAFVMHEYNHVLNLQRWWTGSASYYWAMQPTLDTDADAIPDSLEEALGFVPGVQMSVLPFATDPRIIQLKNRLGYDEHWIVFERTQDFQPGSCDADDWAWPGRNWPD